MQGCNASLTQRHVNRAMQYRRGTHFHSLRNILGNTMRFSQVLHSLLHPCPCTKSVQNGMFVLRHQ
uniref:Uncharacterized protein n=1 Tax=Arundo donax TaxID=35708 RepID=A0A0A8Y2E3_ARUDO